jgi:hypothetical protein
MIRLISVALLFVAAGTNQASAITVELAHKCQLLTEQAFPRRVHGPSGELLTDQAFPRVHGRSGKDAQAYFRECVKNGGKVDDGGSRQAK